ncbi:phage tail tip lysozyme (plasmid) [Thioclava sp. 'Guangxiensis']|uniref:phage tail tip lysozyme n=1 Tax=Thioclava sp. 'Guangxiensis' TaxID=3149044 RepID=UPI0032C499C1
MANPFVMSMRFEGDGAQLKAASAEARKDITSVGAAAGASAKDLDTHTKALERETAATRAAAEAARQLAAAEQEARDRATRAAGATPQTVARALPANLSGITANSTAEAASQRAYVAATTSQKEALRGLGAEVVATRQESALYRAEMDAIRAGYNPLFAASKEYEKRLEEIAADEKIGAINAREAAQAREEAASRMAPVTAAARGHAGAMKLQAHEARNLTYQLNDVFQTLLLGMPPQQVLLQQGPQITQIYGGVGNTFRALTRAMTPMRIGMGLAAGSVLTLGLAYNSYLKSTKEVETASRGVGLAMTGSASELDAAARAGAASAGISVSSARAMQAQFLRTGRIGADNFDELIGLSKDFAATMGIDASKAGDALAEMFADPARAADELYSKYGLIDGATAERARNLTAQNKLAEAQAVLLDALPDRLVEATDATTALGRAWQAVSSGASNAFEWIGASVDRIVDGPSLDERIADAQTTLERTRNASARQRSRQGLPSIEDAQKQLAELQAEADELARQQEERAAEQRGAAALAIADEAGVNSGALRRQKLENELAALQAGAEAPGLSDEQSARIAAAIASTTSQIEALNTRRERENELARIDIQLAQERNPLTRADLQARRTLLELTGEEISETERQARVAAARAREIDAAIAQAQTQAKDLQAETELRAQLQAQVASGAITSEDANRLLENELTLRPLVAAAAAAEGEEKTRLLAVIEGLRTAQAQAIEIDRRANQTQSVRDYLRGQEEKLQMLRLEAALIGQSEPVRQRALAMAEAEQKITALRLDRNSAEAQQIRDRASAYATETRELQKQIDAWNDIRSAGENAVDGIVDKLMDGDAGGAFESLAEDILGTVSELGIKNPLKNAFFGSDYATFDDVGGLKGVFARLTGATDPSVTAMEASAVQTPSMQVHASTVSINGNAMSFAASSMETGLAANANGLPGGKEGTAQQIWDYFSAKGLAPHQVAAIVGNASAESALNPLAIGDGGTSFGLFQHHADRGAGLLSSVGGLGGLGNINGQLDYVWKELLTSESGVLERLKASTNVTDATAAFTGFERPQGWSAANPAGALGWGDRLGAAEDALSKFTQSTGTAGLSLGELGQGFGSFGQALSGAFQGGSITGGSGDLLSSLVGIVGGAFGLPGFKVGGETGGSDPNRVAGVVHEQEFVFDAAATRRIGPKTLEAMRRGTLRGFQTGGYVSAINAPFMPSETAGAAGGSAGYAGPLQMTVNNYGSEPVEAQQSTDSRGQPQVTMTIGRQMAAAASQPGNPFGRSMQARYNMKPATRSRG